MDEKERKQAYTERTIVLCVWLRGVQIGSEDLVSNIRDEEKHFCKDFKNILIERIYFNDMCVAGIKQGNKRALV